MTSCNVLRVTLGDHILGLFEKGRHEFNDYSRRINTVERSMSTLNSLDLSTTVNSYVFHYGNYDLNATDCTLVEAVVVFGSVTTALYCLFTLYVLGMF